MANRPFIRMTNDLGGIVLVNPSSIRSIEYYPPGLHAPALLLVFTPEGRTQHQGEEATRLWAELESLAPPAPPQDEVPVDLRVREFGGAPAPHR